MRIKVLHPATLPNLVRQLGVTEGRVAQVVDELARTHRVAPDALLPAGHELTIADDAFTAPKRLADIASDLSSPVHVAGLFAAASGDTKNANPLGALASLASIDVVNRSIGSGDLSVKVALRPGRHALPLGDRKVRVEVARDTTLHLKAGVTAGANGLELSFADLSFSDPVTVQNPADLSFLGHTVAGDLANSVIQVALDGISVARDGQIKPRGSIIRPSLNPLKHLFSTGKSTTSLETLVALTSAPRLPAGVTRLGRVEAPAARSSDSPLHFEVDQLINDLGGVVDQGTFNLRLEGRSGFVDVSQGQLKVVGANRNLSATLSGSFQLKDGALAVQGTAEAPLPLSAQVRFGDGGAPGAELGPLRVASVDGAMHVFVQGALLGSVKTLADRVHLAVPEHVALTANSRALVHANATIRPTPHGVLIDGGQVRVAVEVSGARAHGGALDVTLGQGSTVSFESTGISTDGHELHVDSATTGFSVTAKGTAKVGPFTLAIDGAQNGAFALTDSGVDGALTYRLEARPKLGFVPMPGKGVVEGQGRVVLGHDAVGFGVTQAFRIKL